MKLEIKTTKLFKKNYEAQTRIVVNQGGTRSGKTYTILQLLLGLAFKEKLHISVCSITLPHLKKGALKDFIEILDTNGLYSEDTHNKTDQVFRIGRSTIEFFSLDNPAKARGPGRDILFINEANLIPFETYKQLLMRTRKQVFLDFNPSDEFHWIYDNVLTRGDCTFIKSTYLDNPFLPKSQIEEIERYKDLDENFWRVFGLGERGQSRSLIFNNWQIANMLPVGDEYYGIDFGFNNPTAMVRVVNRDNEIYVEEMIYQSRLTNNDVIQLLKELRVKRSPIYADAAEPNRIEEIRRAGYNIKPANKDVKKGIDTVLSRKLHILKNSVNLIKELKSYKYQEDSDGKILEMPVKLNDHLCDAMRYAIHSHEKKHGNYSISFV